MCFFSVLAAFGIGLWNTVGQGILRWLQAKAFPAVVLPTFANDELHLGVRSRRSSDEFKASLAKVPVSTDHPLPATVLWRESGQATRRIFGYDREDLRFLRCRFHPPGAVAPFPVFLWLVSTVGGNAVKGGVPMARKDDDDWWFAEISFEVSVAGWKLGLIDVFDVHLRPRWNPDNDHRGRLDVGIEPSPIPAFFGGYQAGKQYLEDSDVTELTNEFRDIDKWTVPPPALVESED